MRVESSNYLLHGIRFLKLGPVIFWCGKGAGYVLGTWGTGVPGHTPAVAWQSLGVMDTLLTVWLDPMDSWCSILSNYHGENHKVMTVWKVVVSVLRDKTGDFVRWMLSSDCHLPRVSIE